MQLDLQPATEQLIAEQVRSGRFPTAEAVVAAAVEELVRDRMADAEWDNSLDADDLIAIAEADAEADRGELFTPAQVREEVLGPLRERL